MTRPMEFLLTKFDDEPWIVDPKGEYDLSRTIRVIDVVTHERVYRQMERYRKALKKYQKEDHAEGLEDGHATRAFKEDENY